MRKSFLYVPIRLWPTSHGKGQGWLRAGESADGPPDARRRGGGGGLRGGVPVARPLRGGGGATQPGSALPPLPGMQDILPG